MNIEYYDLLAAEAVEETIETTASETTLNDRLDEIIEGQHAIYDTLWLIVWIAVICIVFKIAWTVFSKWYFGGV